MGLPIIFISYSHKDEPNTLATGSPMAQLRGAPISSRVKHGVFSLWDDRHMTGGEDWTPRSSESSRMRHFHSAVSAHAMASNYIIDKEIAIIRRAAGEGRTVHFYPLLLTPTPKAAWRRSRTRTCARATASRSRATRAHDRQQHMSQAADEIAEIANAL